MTRNPDPSFLKRAAAAVLNHLDQPGFSGNELSAVLFLSREQTHRKIKQHTSLSTGKFIRRIRILKACVLLLEGNQSVSEIGFSVGFEDPSYFNKCFSEEAGISPGQLKKTGQATGINNDIFAFYRKPEINEVLRQHGIVLDAPGQVPRPKRTRIAWLLIPAGLGVLAIVLFSLSRTQRPQRRVNLGSDYAVAVLPFSNKTGDSALAFVGDMASSWISNQLAEVKSVQTVPYFTVKQYQSYLGILPDDPDKRPTFRELVAAKYFVNGDYYVKGDEIYFHTRFVDAATLKSIYNFPVAHAPRDSVMSLIENIRLKIAGLITNLDEVKLGKRRPPNYEAYHAYLSGLRELNNGLYNENAIPWFEKAAVLQPDFAMPRLFLFWTFNNQKRDSLLKDIGGIENITEYEKRIYQAWSHVLAHRFGEALKLVMKTLEDYPQDYYFNMMAGYLHKSLFMPERSLRVLNQLHDPLKSDFGMIWHYFKVFNKTESLLMLHRYEEALNYLQSIPPDQYNIEIPRLLINVYVKLGKNSQQVDELIVRYVEKEMTVLMQQYHLDKEKLYAEYFTAAAWEFCLVASTPASHYFASKALGIFAKIPGSKAYGFDKTDALYLSGDYRATKSYLEEQLRHHPRSEDLLTYLAQVNAAMGNEREALRIIDRFASQSLVDFRRHEFRYQKDYILARLYALLGNREQSCALLKSALARGQLAHYNDFRHDVFLKSLFDYPPFPELTAPRDTMRVTASL